MKVGRVWRWVQILAAIGLIAAAIYGVAQVGIAGCLEWLETLGEVGFVPFVLGYWIFTALMLPSSWLMALCGFLWGPLTGFLTAWPLVATGSLINFAIGKLLRGRFGERMLATRPTLAALDRAVEQNGLQLAVLLRLSPIFPANPISLGLGMTRMRARDFAVGTVFGFLPVIALNVYLGSTVTSLRAMLEGGGPEAPAAVYWIGLAVTVVVTIAVTRVARRALLGVLDDVVEQDGPAADQSVATLR